MKNSIVIPVHSSKISWISAKLNSFIVHTKAEKLKDITFYIGASDQNQALLISNVLGYFFSKIKIEIVCIQEYIDMKFNSPELSQKFSQNIDGCVVNIKKFILIRYAFERGSEYVCSIDDDSLFISDTDGFYQRMIENYNKSIYFSVSDSPFGDIIPIVDKCLSYFNSGSLDKLTGTTSNRGRLFPWFFDAPLYKVDDYREFEEYMSNQFRGLINWLQHTTWHSFEHTIFVYWRCLKKNAQLFDVEKIGIQHKVESLRIDQIIRIFMATGYCPVWIYLWEYMHVPSTANILPNIHLCLHTDRIYPPQNP